MWVSNLVIDYHGLINQSKGGVFFWDVLSFCSSYWQHLICVQLQDEKAITNLGENHAFIMNIAGCQHFLEQKLNLPPARVCMRSHKLRN